MKLKKLSMTLTGKIAFSIVIVYLIIAIIVPILPIHNPMSYHAPPQDIFRPHITNKYIFNQKISQFAIFGYELFVLTDNGSFIYYDTAQHQTLATFNLTATQFSSIKIMHTGLNGFPIFHSSKKVYLFSPIAKKLYSYNVSGVFKVFPIEVPFSSYYGFIAVNSSGMYAYKFDPYTETQSYKPCWRFTINNPIIGVHYSYSSIYFTTPSEFISLNQEGNVTWRVNGTFTSNPVFIPVYGNNKIYVASKDKIDIFFSSNGTYFGNITMPVKITNLEYYGQSLYAYSPKGIFGKVNLIENKGFLWDIKNIKEYSISPWISGMGAILNDGKLVFILTGDGTIQWGTMGNFSQIAMGDQNNIPYLFTLLKNRTTIEQYSYSGTLITPLPPSMKYPLGTDSAGRDVLSQLLWGFRTEMYIAFVSGFLVLVLGTIWGLTAGYFSGLPDDLLLLLSDSLLFIPAIGYAALMIFLFGIVHHIGATITASILALAPLEARAVRNYTKVIKEKPFVESARVVGASFWRIVFKHILPEVRGISFVYALSATTMALLLEVGISFLGFGNYTIPTWGWMITNAYFTGYLDKWWLIVPPLITLWLLVYSLYLLSQEMYATQYILSIESRTVDDEK